MKTLLVLISLSLSSFAMGSRAVTCNVALVKSLIPKVESHSPVDKNQHCSISCLLGLRCSKSFVLFVGYSKEGMDLFTPGDADWNDIEADMLGLELAKSSRARNDKGCFQQCDSYFPRK